MNRIFISLFLVIITILMNLTSANAVTLHWGSAVGDFIYESDGTTAVTDTEFTFELGAFADGFAPSAENLDDWANNWHTLDVGSYNPSNGFLAGSVSLSSDGSVTNGNAAPADTADFFFGKDAYIWIYNDNMVVDETMEWNLLSNPTGGGDAATAWTFPTATTENTRDVVDFRLSDDGVTPTFGGENQGTASTGAGYYSDPVTGEPTTDPQVPTSPYGLQTFTIPEPGSTTLLLLGLSSLLLTRKRRES